MNNATTWDSREQAFANKVALLTSSDFSARKEALEKLTEAASGITWALSCSSNLFLRGLIDDFGDFDILLDMKDVEKFKTAFQEMGGQLMETVQKRCFSSPYYQEGVYGDVHFDIVGDITVNTYGTQYCYQLCPEEIETVNLERNVLVPLCPIEANFLLYGMMEGWQARRRYKRELCFSYLSKYGLQYPDVLQSAMTEQNLPKHLKELLKALL